MLRAAQFLGVLAALFADAFVLPPPLPATTSLRRRSTVPRVSARSTFSRTDEVSDVPLVSAPQWRGHLHRNGALVFPLGAAWLCREARSARALAHALVFAAAVQGIMSVSAVLHTTEWFRAHRLQRARLADYSMIFLGIAMLYSSLGALIMGHARIFHALIRPLVWLGALAGIGGKVFFLNSPKWVEAASFLSQGWACMLAYGAIRTALTPVEWRMLLCAGLSCTAGVASYVLQWPKYEWHSHKFAAHEVFHLGTMGMFAGFSALMLSLVRRM